MDLYSKYLELGNEGGIQSKGARLFKDYQALMRIWTHPWVMKLDEIRQENKVRCNNFLHKIVNIFLPITFIAYVLGAQKNCLIETVLLSTHNICFG